MEREEIEKELKDIISDLLSIDKSSIRYKSNIVNDLQADSLDAIEIIMEVEDRFDISIKDDEADKVFSFGLLLEFIERKVNK